MSHVAILPPKWRIKLRDKLWRINHLYKIINKEGDLVTFKMNFEQSSLFFKYRDKRPGIGLRENILKDRQIGITTFHVLYYLDEVIFNKNRTAAIIAHEREALEKIFRKAKLALENMPPFLIPKTTIENKNELTFSNLNSSIYIALKVRSGTIHHLHVSEIAYIRDHTELISGSFSAVPMLGDITCETTGNGLNDFHDDWESAKDSKVWRNHFFSWLDHKDYVSDIDIDRHDYDDYLGDIPQERKNWWYIKLEEKRNDFGIMKQEYPMKEEDAFLHSGKGIFKEELDHSKIPELEPLYKADEWFTVYEEPIVEVQGDSQSYHAEYCIGADTSLGHKDGDPQCFYIMNSKTWNIAAVWHGNIAPDLYGNEMVKWAEYYNMAFVGIEENNSGIAVINTVKESYSNLYQRERRDKVTEEVTHQLGWFTSEKSKDEIIAAIKPAIRDLDVAAIPSALKSELITFVLKDNGKREALQGKHDDHVMAFGITLMMLKHNPYYEITTKKPTYMGHETTYNRR